MYSQPYRSHRQGNRFPQGGRGRAFGGGRPIRSFNPHALIQHAQDEREHVELEYVATHKFSDFAIEESIKRNVISKGYTTPTPIQDQAIPQVLSGRDIIGIANTGTGKTAAFLLPLIDKVLKNRSQKVLIVAPTRELACQIQDEFVSFSRGLGIYSVLCIGGTNMFRQKNDLRRQFNFVVGTPGRLRDLMEERHLNVSGFGTVVLDEADHMVDIGFLQDIQYIISLLPKTRQSLFFSATIDGKVKLVLQNFVHDPVTVSVSTRKTTQNVTQNIIPVLNSGKKLDQLHDLLIQKEYEKVLIFGRTKWGVQKLSDELVKRGFKADAIHGNKRQSQRMRTLARFKSNDIQILLATDVASRGLDIPDVSHVINYDLPESQDAYIHRIGRTGRAGKKGVAITFTETRN